MVLSVLYESHARPFLFDAVHRINESSEKVIK